MEEERSSIVKDSKMALLGVANGVFGSILYEIIAAFFVSLCLTFAISSKNPGTTQEQLTELISNAYDSFPYAILISLVTNVITLIVFVFILKIKRFKEICKNAINMKTLKYGAITLLCIMGFSILYNSVIMAIFDLDGNGNANQEAVISLIKQNAILGLITVVILAPLVEELTYRYCMFGEINKRNKILAYAISGFVFMLMHSISSFSTAGGFNKELLMELVYLPPYLFSGLALCYAYDKTNNLGASFIAHLLNNLISFLSIVCL